MIELELTIDQITVENNNGNDKVVLSCKNQKNKLLFIEFQGKNVKKVEPFIEGQIVNISFSFNGKISSLGRRYNNIIGHSIKPKQNAKPTNRLPNKTTS